MIEVIRLGLSRPLRGLIAIALVSLATSLVLRGMWGGPWLMDVKGLTRVEAGNQLGLFTIVSVALLVTGVIVLGAGALFQPIIPAESLVYDSVNGLDVGASVKYRGVPIGKVSALRFAYTKYPEAAADLENKENGRDIRGVLIEMEIQQHAFPGESAQQMKDTATRLVARGLRALRRRRRYGACRLDAEVA